MRTTQATVILVLMFMLAAGAGAVAAKLISHVTPPPTITAVPVRATLSQELGLNDAQREQMSQIWLEAQGVAHACASEAQDIQHDYDNGVLQLLTEEQKIRYKDLTDQTKAKVKALEVQRNAAFKAAVDKTNNILTPPQREIYEKIRTNRLGLTGAGSGLDRSSEDASTPPAPR